jgi:hypothetical protein
MTKRPPRRVLKEAAATPAEIAAAIEALTSAQLAKLKQFAKNRIWKLGPKAGEKTPDDLFQIAVDSLLDDTRRWDKRKVDLFGFLRDAMRSISSNWAKSYSEEVTAVLEADLRKANEEGQIYSPLDVMSDGHADPEERVIAEEKRRRDQEMLNEIEHTFKDDEEAQMMLSAIHDGYDPPGTRELWGWSQNDYNTIIRRIRRTLDRAGMSIDGPGGEKNGK